MKYQLNDKKTINIPDEEIKKSMKILDLTEEEAIQMYLEDEGYIKNEEVERLTKKAKENKADKIVVRSKTENTRAERPPKENPVKEQLIKDLCEFLKENGELEPVTIVNKTKTIDFYVNGRYFSLNLTEHRPKKQK